MSQVDTQLENLKSTIEQEVPSDVQVTDVKYEGPELVVYTRDPKEFAGDGDLIRRLASKLRKRITVRPDPSVLSSPDRAEAEVREVIPEAAGVTDLDFHEDTGEVVIEAQKPGMVIGRRGSTLREITQEVGWTPEVVRTPPIESSTVSNVRGFLKNERDERRDILERVRTTSGSGSRRSAAVGRSDAPRSCSRRRRPGSSSTAATSRARRARFRTCRCPRGSGPVPRPSTRWC
jgi:predicted metal-dependent RNase